MTYDHFDDFDFDDNIDAVSIPTDQVATPPAAPFTDDVSRAVVNDVVTSLTLMRFPLSLLDATAELHVLASLIQQANARIVDAVAEALDQDHLWCDIALCLGVSTSTARRRYSPQRANHARPPLALD
ncbi:MAG: hypothetical protein ACREQ5_28065 [Candidatus Dormibacteria bacterium]